MKQREVIRKIAQQARASGLSWTLARHGANHDVYDLDGLMVPIPRHAEVTNRFAVIVWRECEPKLGKDWWK
jgi:hypothetical protein